jgi:tetratricopeptide (TPR) repeat protein
MTRKFLFLLMLLIPIGFTNSGLAQNAKKHLKMGNDYNKLGNYELAIEHYSKALEIDSKLAKAYEARAAAYEQTEQYLNAAEDYESLGELSKKNVEFQIKASNLFSKVGEYRRALELIHQAEQSGFKSDELYTNKARCLYALENYSKALDAANAAIQAKPSPENHYIRGLIRAQLKNFQGAEDDFTQSGKLKPEFTNAFLQQAEMALKQGKNKEAIHIIGTLIEKDSRNKLLYMNRGRIFAQMNDVNSAILDYTKAISISQDVDAYAARADLYFHNSQFSEALNDYNKALQSDRNNLSALEKRAICFQKTGKKEEAIRDLKQILALAGKATNVSGLAERITKNLFELNREKNKPLIQVLNSRNIEIKSIELADGLTETLIRIKVEDESDISSLQINKKTYEFHNDSLKNGQQFRLNIADNKTIEIVAEDVYQNKAIASIMVKLTDAGLPGIEISSPIASDDGFIYLTSFEPEVVIEGKILGKNTIDSLEINNKSIDFRNIGPHSTFKTKINIDNIETLSFLIKDSNGNKVTRNFKLDRTDAAVFNENPMGRTWVVFVENSDYAHFTDLDGPKKEVDLMIKALSKYKIDNIIHKRNLNRSQMQHFFSTELKNQITSNRVNSLLIWFAGHGKLQEQNSFWVPVDSKIDDFNSYYSLNTLKAAIKPYMKNVTHSLIVTDACETGPSFYMAMRAITADRNCDDTKSTKFKSSQIFTSSGYDGQDSDSQFTKTFANALMFDSNICVPIERIVRQVTSEVTKSSNKRPKFGKIAGFEDENGTFIFIKK